jgi:uncharacterized membrane protein
LLFHGSRSHRRDLAINEKEYFTLWTSFVPSFLASIVEFVEALTIVLVIGVTINWRSSLWGAITALGALAILIATFGAALVTFVPLGVLRLVIGLILVLFGLQWLLKAVLRYSGLKALHDEAAISEREQREVAAMKISGSQQSINGFGFATCFKAVLLEGLEVAFIVVSFGTSVAGSEAEKTSGLLMASLGASLAALVVIVAGILLRHPLTKIPENTLKYVVGILLSSFGTFWAGEGLGVDWRLGDLTILLLALLYFVASATLVFLSRTKATKGVEL